MSVVLLALAVTIPTAGYLWLRPGAATPAQAWTAVPLPQDSAILARAEEVCGHGATNGKSPGTGPIDAGLPLSVVDARGNTAVAFFTDDHRYSACQFWWGSDGVVGSVMSWQGVLVSSDASSLDVLTAQTSPGESDKALLLIGHTGPSAARVTIQLGSGREVEASIGHGYYLAWWPEPEQVITIDAADSSGKTLHVLERPEFK